MDIPKSIIHLLIRDGCPIIPLPPDEIDEDGEAWERCISYYSGSSFNTNLKIAVAAHTDFYEFGIDYGFCRNYVDETERGFNGTFADDEVNTIMRCDIVSNNGNTYRFASHFEPFSLAKFVVKLTQLELSLDDARASLEEKIKNCHNNSFPADYFKYQDFKIKL